MNFKNSSLVLLIAICFAACGENLMYDKKYEIQQQRWAYKDTLNFDFEIKDTMKIYNLYLEIEHGNTYPYQNLYLMTHTKFPSALRPAQQMNVDLAEKSGKWLGKKSGNNWTQRVDLQKDAYFSESGKYTLTLEQFMRRDSLPEINCIRFAVEETKQTREQVEVKKGEKPKEGQKKYLIK